MSFFKKAARNFGKAAKKTAKGVGKVAKRSGKTIGNAAKKTGQGIGNAYDATIGKVGKPETYHPQLKAQRARNRALKAGLETAREAYFLARTDLDRTRADYMRMTEDYANATGLSLRDVRAGRIPGDEWRKTPRNDAAKVLKGAETALRHVVGFVTLDMSEGLFAPGEGKRESAHLKRQNAALSASVNRFRKASAGIQTAVAEMAEAVEEVRVKLAGIGRTGGDASHLQVLDAQTEARRAMAARMLGDGVALVDIAAITGLSEGVIASLTPERDPAPTPEGFAQTLAAELEAEDRDALALPA